jgi:HlyD family secretion protein
VRSAPVTIQNVVTYDVVIEVANPAHELKPGMTASVEITTARREDALRVPLRALRFRPEADAAAATTPAVAATPAAADAAAVYVLDGGGALRRVELRTGIRDERFAEVLDGGLAAGQPVVVAYQRSGESEDPQASSPFQPRFRR